MLKQEISYLLFINIKKDFKLVLNNFYILFKKGKYIYVGSALRNINKRVQRHINSSNNKTEKKHWHIDYLLSSRYVVLENVKKYKEKECDLSQIIAKHCAPVLWTYKTQKKTKGFGNSDCNRCESHLYFC